jgi:hypothetical protein
MREYGRVAPEFWIGETGRALRALGPLEQLIAIYFITAPNSSAIGIYHLPIVTLAHAIGSPLEGASKGLRRVCGTLFARYDYPSEEVFIPSMAKFQIGPTIKAGDNRHGWILKELQRLKKSVFLGEFLAIYGDAYHLTEWAEREIPKPLRSPSEAPSEPLRSQEQEQEQEQLQIETKEDVKFPESEAAPFPVLSDGAPSAGADLSNRKPQDRSGAKSDLRAIFDHWRSTTGHGRAKLDRKREAVIRARLRDGYSVSDLCRAIDGVMVSRWHTGENPDGIVYDSLQLILRDAEHVDKFIRLANGEGQTDGARSPQTQRQNDFVLEAMLRQEAEKNGTLPPAPRKPSPPIETEEIDPDEPF